MKRLIRKADTLCIRSVGKGPLSQSMDGTRDLAVWHWDNISFVYDEAFRFISITFFVFKYNHWYTLKQQLVYINQTMINIKTTNG